MVFIFKLLFLWILLKKLIYLIGGWIKQIVGLESTNKLNKLNEKDEKYFEENC